MSKRNKANGAVPPHSPLTDGESGSLRIAVIGSGISGLGAAWLLGCKHDVTVYEQQDRVGGHTNTVSVEDRAGALGVDTGFIVYNERNYPHLTGLFRHLDVPTRATDMSFAASIDQGRLEYAGGNMNTLFGQRRNILNWRHWRMLLQILRFNRHARRVLDHPALEEQSLAEFLTEGGYSDELRDRYLMPMGAAIWSCPVEEMQAFPAAAFLRFFDNHGLLELKNRPQWRTVTGGSREYLRRLTASMGSRIFKGCGATSVRRDADGVSVVDSHGKTRRYDHVVLATHADQALRLLERPDLRETAALAPFRYQKNRAVLHTDTSLMPRCRRVWSCWNYLSDSQSPDRPATLSVTYWMNRLQGLPANTDYLVTLNPSREPAPEHVIATFDYEHPVFDQAATRAQPLLARLQGHQRTWFCGSYTGYGFHEDGLRSGVEVARHFGIHPPWEAAPAASSESDDSSVGQPERAHSLPLAATVRG